MTAREIALKALFDIETKERYISAVLKNALSGRELSDSDKGLITELIYGIVSNKTAIDFIISRYSKIKLKKMTPWVLNILRMGVFQIYYMDKIPYSAACNEAVKLAKKYSHKAGSGFVNGVLRSFSKDAESFEFPDGKSAAEDLSVKYSYPLWMTEKLVAEYGPECSKKLFEDTNNARGVFLRCNSLKISEKELLEVLDNEGIVCEKTDIPNAFLVKGRINIEKSDAYKKGYYSLQNISSQRAISALDPKCGQTVIDMCAAPGGKSCAIAEKMNNEGKIYSFDIFQHKIELIKKSAERLGITIISPKVHDARTVNEDLLNSADCVLADVPCSGLGVIHKKPDIKWKRTEEDVKELCLLQKEILETAAGYVKRGGTLLYSTCTILPEENRIQISEFLNTHSEYKKVFEEQILTTEFGASGFYICKMIKE